MFHATSRRRRLLLQQISPRTTLFYIWHNITPQSASHHHITPHLEAQHVPHLAPFHTRNYSTPHPHSTSQHRSSHHTIFHIALHHQILILHHTTSDITTHRLHFHFSDVTTIIAHCICHILHHHISHHVTFHILQYVTFRIARHHCPHHAIFHITHFAAQSHSTSYGLCEIATVYIAPHFTSHHNLHQITPHLGAPFHITPTFHMCQAHYHIQI